MTHNPGPSSPPPPQYAPQPGYGWQQPPGNPYYQGPYYAAPTPYPMAPPARPATLSLVSMILGLTSIFFGGIIFMPAAAIVLGIIGLRREPNGKALAITGIIAAAVSVIIWVVVVIVFVVFFSTLASQLSTGTLEDGGASSALFLR